eukprot:TRINITY_DN3476_c2_g1_i7.p2 TRINITY_DN3476_c2_g1~~TRINITY_DN3476_c2_g1_i7.p2  ORF type:complete len:244 (+),score=-19.43 TRINITY_DN3476_c2_g1_i7:954-1685(+)
MQCYQYHLCLKYSPNHIAQNLLNNYPFIYQQLITIEGHNIVANPFSVPPPKNSLFKLFIQVQTSNMNHPQKLLFLFKFKPHKNPFAIVFYRKKRNITHKYMLQQYMLDITLVKINSRNRPIVVNLSVRYHSQKRKLITDETFINDHRQILKVTKYPKRKYKHSRRAISQKPHYCHSNIKYCCKTQQPNIYRHTNAHTISVKRKQRNSNAASYHLDKNKKPVVSSYQFKFARIYNFEFELRNSQ